MIHAFLIFLIISAVFVIRAKKMMRVIVYLSIFSLMTALCFFLLASPDVAMAEAVISTFATIIYIIAFEKHSSHADFSADDGAPASLGMRLLPALFCASLFALFLRFVPDGAANPYLQDLYAAGFGRDIGGENAVTAIYLGYRKYDTLFEALMLIVSIVAVIHMSQYADTAVVPITQDSHVIKTKIVLTTISLICPALLVFGAYLIFNGHISAGGGFQGGVVIATFFICRYVIYEIYDIRQKRIVSLEKLFYAQIVLLAVSFLLLGAYGYYSIPKDVYLIMMNLFIGAKVAIGFLIIFYRFVAFERR